jgi:hypothetical protein
LLPYILERLANQHAILLAWYGDDNDVMRAPSLHNTLTTTLPWISKRHQIDETPHIDDKTLLGNRISTAHLFSLSPAQQSPPVETG